jgi:DNA topoisomerase-1
VHETVVNAFEDGVLEQFAERLRSSRSNSHREKVLAQIAAQVKTMPRPDRSSVGSR